MSLLISKLGNKLAFVSKINMFSHTHGIEQVDTISEILQQRCGSFCSTDDVMLYKVIPRHLSQHRV